MPISPLDTFNHAVSRADHFLTLYDILHNSRQRGIRSNWRDRFNRLMRWPVSEAIERIDGKNRDSMLILRESLGVTRAQFGHDYTPELLRSAIASSVSALDRYLHDVLVHRCITLLSRREEDIPNKLQQLRLPVLTTKKALEKLRSDPTSRPGAILKKEIQKVLHQDHTFQNPHGIEVCANMLGIDSLWKKMAGQMPGSRSAEEIKEDL